MLFAQVLVVWSDDAIDLRPSESDRYSPGRGGVIRLNANQYQSVVLMQTGPKPNKRRVEKEGINEGTTKRVAKAALRTWKKNPQFLLIQANVLQWINFNRVVYVI